MDLVPMLRMLEPATELAVALDHPAYDCIDLSLAQSTGCSFVTANDRLGAKVRGHGLLVQVLGLSDALDQLS